MRLQRLTGLEREKIEEEYEETIKLINYLKEILADERLVLNIIKEELLEIKAKYNDDRRTHITAKAEKINIEDMIEEEDVVITLTHFGYVKRLPVDTYKSQRRGGKGTIGLTTREEDFVENLVISSSHDYLLIFTNLGKVYKLNVYEIPEARRQARGTAIVNLIPLETNEVIAATIPVDRKWDAKYLLLALRTVL